MSDARTRARPARDRRSHPPAGGFVGGVRPLPSDYATQRRLHPQPEAADSDLVAIGLNPGGQPVRLARAAAEAWHRLKSAASADGLELIAISGFRSIERQAEIVRGKLARGQPLAAILRATAAPGFSEHHTGRAIDLGTSGTTALEESFASTDAFRWLERRAAEFGFHLSYARDNPHGFIYEP
ncbi:MAG: M15 family metallopeptidase, partial [Opitutaceae bacterium]